MTKVDFYILPERDISERHQFACRLVEKVFRLGHPVYIHSDDEAQANAVDRLLWSFRDSSFIPHQLVKGGESGSKWPHPVQIGYLDEVLEGLDAPGSVLVNLSTSVPQCFSRFDRVTEIVVQDPIIQQATRTHFRFYRDRGYELQTHDLR